MNSSLAAPPMTFDLHRIAPRKRRALIFARFDALHPGPSLELINDHGPRPLRVQVADRAFGKHGWPCMETGPSSRRVRIRSPGPTRGLTPATPVAPAEPAVADRGVPHP